MILYTLLMSLLLSFAHAMPTQHDLDKCEHEGANFGNGKGADFISSQCFSHFSQVARPNARKESPDGLWKVIGFRNMVFVDQKTVKGDQRYLISGSSTQLKEVIAVAIDEVHQELAVLESSGDVLFFSMTITGNVAPLRVLRAKDLDGAVDLVINSNTDEVIVLNTLSHSLLFYSRLANIHQRKELQKLNCHRVIGFFNVDGSYQGNSIKLDKELSFLKIYEGRKEVRTIDLVKKLNQ